MSQTVGSTPELVHHVISYLPPPVARHSRIALARCACVSRVFSACALPRLWKTLPCISPLWGLLPSSHEYCDDWTYVSVAPIVDAEWARLVYYANLVVFVEKYNDTLLDSIDPFALAGILGRLQGKPLLPRLCGLTWEVGSSGEPYFLHLLPTSLRLLNVTFPRGNDGVRPATDGPTNEDYCTASALQQVHERVPDLPTLCTNNARFPCVLRTVGRFSKLSRLQLRSVYSTSAIVAFCGGLEQLRDLRLEYPYRWDSEAETRPPSDTPSVGFHALRTIRVDGSVGDAVAILAAIQSPRVYSVELNFEWGEMPSADDFATLDLPRWERTMRTLKIHVKISGHSQDSLPTFSTAFEPFYSLRRLRTVDIDARSATFKLGDQDIAEISGAWRRLNVLSIVSSGHKTARPAPPHLDSLWAFVESCPDLRRVTLDNLDFSAVLNAENPEEGIQRLEARSSEHQLLSFGLQHSTVAEEKKDLCKACLERIFPYASELNIEKPRDR